MKRTALSRGTSQLKRSGFRKPSNPKFGTLRRSKLRVVGVSTSAQLKQEIQALVRDIVIKRDGGCILRDVRGCGGEAVQPNTKGERYNFMPGGVIDKVVLQADHLITRANSATYADTRLIVCLCRPCHGGFKKWHEKEYEAMVKPLIGPERTKLWEQKETERLSGRTTHFTIGDWKLTIAALTQERGNI